MALLAMTCSYVRVSSLVTLDTSNTACLVAGASAPSRRPITSGIALITFASCASAASSPATARFASVEPKSILYNSPPSGSAQVIGIEALVTREVKNTHDLLIRHIDTCRKIPDLAPTRIVLVLESNLAFEAQHLVHAMTVSGIKSWIALSEGQGGTLGWLTTNSRKDEMALLLREALRMGRISLHGDFFSLTMETKRARQRLFDELSNYSVINDAPKTAFGKMRKTYTGKVAGMQDDCAITLQLAMIGAKTFFVSEKYSNFRRVDYTHSTAQSVNAEHSRRGTNAGRSF